jgi:hypothetical protein
MTLASVFTAVIVKGSQTCESSGLLATDPAELRHADDKRERGAFANAGNAEHEIKASGEIVVSAYLLGNVAELGAPSCLQSCNVTKNYAPQPRRTDMFEPGLQARNVFLDLLNEGQKVRKLGKALIRPDPRLLHCSRAGCNQDGIERIVLGAPQMHPRVGAHLDRLQDQDCKAGRPQMTDHAALIAARRLDPHTLDPNLGKVRTQPLPTLQCVLNAPMPGLTVNRNIELVLGRIDAGHHRAMLLHLRRPLPCEANQVVPATIRVR